MKCPVCRRPGRFPAIEARARGFDGWRDCALLANRFGIVAPCRMIPDLGFHACDLVYGCETAAKFSEYRTVGSGQNKRVVEVAKRG